MTIICHVSDWHGRLLKMPKADMYIVTGDMLHNSFYHLCEEEVWMQKEDSECIKIDKECFENRNAPIICVRGNHDCIDLKNCFENTTFEFDNEIFSFWVNDVKFGGIRGIFSRNNDTCDEYDELQLLKLMSKVPKDIDVLVTHSPPYGILDYYENKNTGSMAIRRYIDERLLKNKRPLKAHFFGHCHIEPACSEVIGNTLFSNASCGYLIHDIDL